MTMIASIVSAAAAAGTPTYTQDFTDSGAFAGATPKCALILSTLSTAENTNTSGLQLQVGFVAAAQAGTSIMSNDTSSTNLSAYANYTSQAYPFVASNGNLSGAASASLIADGLRLSWTNQSSDELIKVLLLGGQIEAAVSTFTSAGGTAAQTVTHGLTAAPELIIAIYAQGSVNTDNNGAAEVDIGFWTGAAQNTTGHVLIQNAQTTVASFGRIDSTHAISRKQAGAGHVWQGTINNVGATTFDITQSVSASSSVVHFLSIRSTSGTVLAVKTGTFTTRTSTGTNADVSGMSLAPQVLMALGTRLTAVDTNDTTTAASAVSVGVVAKNTGTGSLQYMAATVNESDGSATSGAHAYSQVSNTQHIRILDTVGVADVEATVNGSAFDAGGVTHNYSNVTASAQQVVYLAFGADVVAGAAGILRQLIQHSA